jgi:DNA-directed RNA polymerase sigma subunit (sigma70/sigma32)
MPNLKQLAPISPTITVVDLTSTSKALVKAELSLINAQNINFIDSLAKLNKQKRYQSIICCALSRHDRSDEDIISEALLLLQIASFKYFAVTRTINFRQFAITYIRENIKLYKNKQNHRNGSDLNESIHYAIKAIKKCKNRKVEYLLYEEAKHLAEHFGLDNDKGIRKIFKMEAIQFGSISDWAINKDGKEYYRLDDQENDVSDPNYKPSNAIEKKAIEKQNLNILANQNRLFIDSCNNKESIIFKKRISCNEKITLDELSKSLNISIQRISMIEKTLYEKFVNFCKNSIENKKIADKE